MKNRAHAATPLAIALLLCLFSPALAAAQASTGELRDGLPTLRVAGSLGVSYLDRDGFDAATIQPSVFVDGVVFESEGVFVSLDAAWQAAGAAGDISAFRAGNPLFGARAGYYQDGLRVRGGVALTLPLTNAYDDSRALLGGGLHGIIAMATGLAMQGNWDPWLLSYLNMALVFRGDFEYRAEYFDVGVEGAFAPMFPVEYEGRTGDTTLAAQIGGWAAARPLPELAVGTRLHAVMLDSTAEDTSPVGFLALTPFVRGEFDPAFVEARVVVNLVSDNYEGIYGQGGLPWGVFVLGGVALED